MSPVRIALGRRVLESRTCMRCLWELCLNWVNGRHSWRVSVFYKVLAGVCAVGIVLTFALHALISSSFFTNFRCGRRAKRHIKMSFVAVMVIAGVIGLLSLLTSRLIGLFMSHSLGEFKFTGHWMSKVGFLVKWLPWCISFCMFAMIVLLTISVLWVLLEPTTWCERRWSVTGLHAVKNCKLWYSPKIPCLTTAEKEDMDQEADSCNDGDFLAKHSFLFFVPKSPASTCSLSTPGICLLFKEYYSAFASKTNPNWSFAKDLGCRGSVEEGVSADKFMAAASSDLYRYIVIYATAWCVALAAMLMLFFYIKYTSHFESYFLQPTDNTNNFILPVFRPLTPWNAGAW